MKSIFNQLLGRFGKPPLKNMEAAGERVFQDVFVRREGARLTSHVDVEPVRFKKSRIPVLAFALATLGVVLIAVPFRQPDRQLESEIVRADGNESKVFKLADGSRVEMRAGSELSIERASDGVRLYLNQGKIIVNAAKQRNGHLYVNTRDITVSVVGTVFFVTTEEIGSSVGVLEGLVSVSHGKISRKLKAGEEFSTPPPSTAAVLFEEVAWSRYAEEHRALLQQEPEKAGVSSPVPQSKAPSRTFEAISIRRNTSLQEGGTFGDGGPGRFRSRNMPIGELLRVAYGVQDFELVGSPNWLETERYDIEAKLEKPQGPDDEMQPLIQTLLADRFKLRVHGEAREASVYFLAPAKGGLKLKAGRPCTAPELSAAVVRGRDYSAVCGFLADGNRGNDVVIEGTSISATDLAVALTRRFQRRVLDKTGFTGRFDAILRWRPDGVTDQGLSDRPSIFVVLEEELGLKLESGKAPIDVLVIDHIERPSEN